MACFVESNRGMLDGMGGVNPRHAMRARQFRFLAVPLRARDATSFSIRAFTEILD